MLKLKLQNLDGLSQDEAKHYVKKDDGFFYLDAGPVDGLVVENVTGLKTALERERQSKETLQSQVATLTKTYEGIDVEEAKVALEKYKEVKNWDKDKMVAEAVEASKRDLLKLHNQEKSTLQTELETTMKQLEDATVNREIAEALNHDEVKGNSKLLMHVIKQYVKFEKGADGKRYVKVVGSDGQPRVGDTAGNPMTVLQLCKELKAQPEYAPAFAGTGSTGGGGEGKNRGGTPGSNGTTRVINTNGTVVANDLEGIASGKVEVVKS